MATIQDLKAREVLDSRGNPTVEAELTTEEGVFRAIVPSGASTGTHEAHELRDGGTRYGGKGVQNAVNNINNTIAPNVKGSSLDDPSSVDKKMLELDDTPNKEKLGANAILAVSMAVFRAAAGKKPLWKYLSEYFNTKAKMPVPFANVINGGKHAGGDLYMQEFMLAPIGASSFKEATQMVAETYHVLKKVIADKYGKGAVNVGDEGGFAPPIGSPDEALSLMSNAVEKAGYKEKIKFAMDPAASEFFKDNRYHDMSSDELIAVYHRLLEKYPIISLEDLFAEDDFDSWAEFFKDAKIQVVGDDLTVTNIERMKLAMEKKLCNALLLKMNQIGTVTEAVQAAKFAFENGWKVMVSHRSGESEDPFMADLAVALGCGQIKIGAPCRSDRLAKYNQLLRIEESGLEYSKF